MANILERYGIKEVADVTFYHIDKTTGKPDYPVLYLDTLKVSTIEQTAETADATGGKGNAKLITWDYGKDITVTLEDALFSAKSMAIMFGDGKVASTTTATAMRKTIMFVATAAGTEGVPTQWKGPDKFYNINASGATIYKADAANPTDTVDSESVIKDERYFYTFNVNTNQQKIEINANSFPGTYYVTGDTFARSEANGEDEFFQFIIHKAKVTSENTITLEAEGDPSVFNMNLTVLRPETGPMMELVKYDVVTANG